MKLNKTLLFALLVVIIALGYYWYQQSNDADLIVPDESGINTMLTKEVCEAQGGRVVYGIGPAPECESSETSLGRVKETGAIEGALCCK